jgi:hypothetical protein
MLTTPELADIANVITGCSAVLEELTDLAGVCRPLIVTVADVQSPAFGSRGCAIAIGPADVWRLRHSRALALASVVGQLAGSWCGTGVMLSGRSDRVVGRAVRMAIMLLCLDRFDPSLREQVERHFAKVAHTPLSRLTSPGLFERWRVARLALRTYTAARHKPDGMRGTWRRHWTRRIDAAMLLRELAT